MNREQLLLTVVGEECSEVQQRCSKAIRFGMKEIQRDQPLNNSERILLEFNDLVATIELLYGIPIYMLIDKDQTEAKKEKIEKYINYSAELGIVINKQ